MRWAWSILKWPLGMATWKLNFWSGSHMTLARAKWGAAVKKPAKFLLRDALQGHAEAQQRMILHNQYGDGVPKSPAKAFMWAVVATASGDPKAARQKRGMEAELPAAVVREGHKMAKAFKAKREMVGQRDD